MPVIFGAAAVIIATTVMFSYVMPIDLSAMPAQQDVDSTSTIIGQEAQAYRINTQCEMVYAMVTGRYPGGEVMPRIEITYLLEKYPDEFKPWKEILEDPQKRTEFVKDVPEEFNQALIPIMLKESSINPDLESTGMLLLDPLIQSKLKQIYDENNCQEFFEKIENSTP
jgi:TRAP-type uncharacterized transport system fused permease subunit